MHFYAINAAEATGDMQSRWRLEGIACYLFPNSHPGILELCRLYNSGNGDHLYTTYDGHGGYTDEGVACFVYLWDEAQPQPGIVLLYRGYNRAVGDQEPLRKARPALRPARSRAAEERRATISLATAAEYALRLTAPGPPPPAAVPGAGQLSTRERELVTLVAQGRTNAQIAAQLYISVRTVSSHLDRIRDKTGCRRRADLTRLALTAGLV
jgi:DNA-binding CsgD family transcriptional regulator